jgi:uncharacterized Zn finger protein
MRDYWYRHYTPREPKEAKDGIKARTARGKFSESWWADKWIEALESFGWSNRLQRGRRYARMGQVVDYNVSPGVVTAKVQGTRAKPYKVRIEIRALSDRQWDKVIESMASQAIFAAKLLAGEMPQNIEDAFTSAKVSLFPKTIKDINMNCSCPDWAEPCKHIAAVYYLLAEEFDRDPFMIFHLRGKTKDEVIHALRKKRSIVQETLPAEVQESDDLPIEGFFSAGKELAMFRVSIKPPTVPEAVLKRLGAPRFCEDRKEFMQRLARCYQDVSKRAMEMAFDE